MKKTEINKVEHIDLSGIKNPEFLKTLNNNQLVVLAEDIRKEIIRCTAKNGGHLSSNLGIVELTIAIEKFFDLSKDKIIFDVGHQCYTHKILTGRSLETLRQTGGVSGFQKISESVYDCFDAGHSSTSISAACGFAIARDLKKENYNVIAVIGDGSIPSGLSMEGLNNIVTNNHKVIVILNDNGMSISKPVGGIARSMGKISTAAGYNRIKYGYHKVMFRSKFGIKIYNFTLKFKNWIKRKIVPPNIFTDLGLAYLGPYNGHDFKALEKAFKRVNNTSKSVLIHVCSTKGKGYELAENDLTGAWHGVAPFKVETGKILKEDSNQVSWSKVMSDLTLEEMKKNDQIVLFSPATIVGAELQNVFAAYPKRCFDVGIAEEHAATTSGALSLNGFHPIISIYSTFMQRAYDEIAHDMARVGANATLLVDRAGLVGKDGETHQGIYDEAFLSTIPNVVITMPSNAEEASALLSESMNNHGVFAIRFPRSSIEQTTNNIPDIPFGSWPCLRSSCSNKLAIVGVGPLFRDLEKMISEQDVDCALFNALYINPLDENAIQQLLKFKNIAIYDAYSTQGGLVSSLTVKLSSLGYQGSISAFCIPNVFVKQASINEQLAQFGLLPEQVLDVIKNK